MNSRLHIQQINEIHFYSKFNAGYWDSDHTERGVWYTILFSSLLYMYE